MSVEQRYAFCLLSRRDNMSAASVMTRQNWRSIDSITGLIVMWVRPGCFRRAQACSALRFSTDRLSLRDKVHLADVFQPTFRPYGTNPLFAHRTGVTISPCQSHIHIRLVRRMPAIGQGRGTTTSWKLIPRCEPNGTVKRSRVGLVLLVVLSMLTLFSMLAITYLAVASRSRSASVALARSEHRGTPAPRLLDAALSQLLRGTTDDDSALWKHSLLEDLYGSPAQPSGEDEPIVLRVRSEDYARANPARDMTGSSDQRPMLLAGRFLRVPLESAGLAQETDVYAGRVVTFLSGPLMHQSFHVVRYVGAVSSSAGPAELAQQYSLLIDLSEIDQRQIVSSSVSNNWLSLSIDDWVRRLPDGMIPASLTNLSGTSLCHESVQPSKLSEGRTLLMNDVALNGLGSGISFDSTIQSHRLAHSSSQSPPPRELENLPIGLQPNVGRLPGEVVPAGGADESYDAADMHDFHLAFRSAGASQPEDIVPSFHRAALVNYIANWKDPAKYTPSDLFATLDRIVGASARPLSIQVTNVRSTTPRWPALPGDRTSYVMNPDFSGSNFGSYASGLPNTPQLTLDLQNDWVRTWPTLLPQYVSWLRWLTSGPWDVDNDGDALADSVWVDLNLPPISSPEGKLLRVLVSYYVEDLDGRLDLNAVGNSQQSTVDYAQPTPAADSPFAAGANLHLPQGFGLGAAEASLRPLLASDEAYREFLIARYRSSDSSDSSPGGVGDDLVSQFDDRERPHIMTSAALPALPISPRGRTALGLDRLGNPLLVGSDSLVDDPYESRWRSGGHRDSPFGIGEWERVYRTNDWDRSQLPQRLATLLPATARMAISPRTSHLRLPIFGTQALAATDPVSSFYEMVDVVLKIRLASRNEPVPATPMLPHAAFAEMFPLEFHRAERLNLNRPFGNGRDDDGNGQIDEPSELVRYPQRSYASATANQNGPTVGATNVIEDYLLGQKNLDPASPPPEYQGVQSRQLFARHLYCLAQCLLPADYRFPNLAVPATPELRARILAQWAVNVVDFRDADAAMTRFPYDADPFSNKGTLDKPRFAWEPRGGIVWGMEQPELLLTESLATHDMRVTSDPARRDQYNQYRIPQGSLFLELYCPRTTEVVSGAQLPGAPPSLYRMQGGKLKLDLSRLSPADASGARFPIWRVYIGQSRPAEAMDTPLHRYNDPSSKHLITYQFPSNPWTSGLMFDWKTTDRATEPDAHQARAIVFTPGFLATAQNCPNLGAPVRDQVFVNRGNDILLDGGQYLVIGPRDTTYFGSRRNTAQPPTHQPNTHRIQLARNWARIYRRDPTLSTPSATFVAQRPSMNDAVTMIAAADPPPHWQPGNAAWQPIGINVSEPLPGADYYPIPTSRLNSSNGKANADADGPTGALGFLAIPPDAYHDYSLSSRAPAMAPLDRGQAGTPLENWSRKTTTGTSDIGAAMLAGTQENWCTAFLQRLADPDLPYHAWFNPYLTVDWVAIDLTLFNGEDEPPGNVRPTYKFASRQKTGSLLDPSTLGYPSRGITAPYKTLFSYQTHDLRPTPTSAGNDYLGVELFVDQAIPGSPISSVNRGAPEPDGSDAVVTLGFLNYSFTLAGESPGPAPIFSGFHGAPARVPAAPFWANRPYVNPLELAWVPLSSPGQFMQEFSARDAVNPYSDVSDRSNGFSHLMNWFSHPSETKERTSAAAILEMVEVPSPWSDAGVHIAPGATDFIATPQSDVEQASNLWLFPLRAPYNRLTRFVEPGRVNLNTVSEPAVWRAIMWNAMTPATDAVRNHGQIPFAKELEESRRGYSPMPSPFIPSSNKYLHPEFPSQFSGVFKSSLSAGMVPNTSNDSGAHLSDRLDERSRANPAQATLLRGALVGGRPLFSPQPNVAHPHPFTEFLPLTRLANLVTTRSNVYAVRITVGYFEFNPQTGLGLEFGTERGQSRRHRAFYVVDRSIPVGFQVGQDLNTNRCILVRRIIE